MSVHYTAERIWAAPLAQMPLNPAKHVQRCEHIYAYTQLSGYGQPARPDVLEPGFLGSGPPPPHPRSKNVPPSVFLFSFLYLPFFPFLVCLLFLTKIMNKGNRGVAQRTDLIFKVNYYCGELSFEVFSFRGK